MQYISNSLEQTSLIAKEIVSKIKPNDIITLDGDLGVGKTTFTSYLVKYLGSQDMVYSPTFTLINHYRAQIDIFHFDMYRLSKEDDLVSIDFYDYLDNGSILIIEWSCNIKSFLSKLNLIRVNFRYLEDNKREISIISDGDDRFCSLCC